MIGIRLYASSAQQVRPTHINRALGTWTGQLAQTVGVDEGGNVGARQTMVADVNGDGADEVIAIVGGKLVARDLQSFQSFLTAHLTSAPNVTSVKTAVPGANDGLVQLIAPFAPTAGVVQVQPTGLARETNVSVPGSVSGNTTEAALLGPLLVAVIVYVRFEPATTGSGESTIVSDRSAEVETVVVAVALLFAPFGSPVVDVTFAVFESTVPDATVGATATVSVNVAVPTANDGFVQLTVPAAPTAGVVQLQPATAGSDTNVVPVGSTVAFPNSDPIRHNVYSTTPGSAFDFGFYGEGESRERVFDQPGLVVVNCNVHHVMQAQVLVVPTAYQTRADASGKFKLTDLPAGRGVLHFWHPRAALSSLPVSVPTGSAIERKLVISKPRVAR